MTMVGFDMHSFIGSANTLMIKCMEEKPPYSLPVGGGDGGGVN